MSNVFAKVVAINARDPFPMKDGRTIYPYEVTLSIPEVRAGQTSGSPFVEAHHITADLMLNQGEECKLAVGSNIVADIFVTSNYSEEHKRWFSRIKLVRFVDMSAIQYKW